MKSTNSASFNETLDGIPQLSVCDPIQITHQSAATLPSDKDLAVGLGAVDSQFRVPIWFTSKVIEREMCAFWSSFQAEEEMGNDDSKHNSNSENKAML